MPRTDHPTTLDRARALLAEARRLLVLTGAGISHESGVPTFRGPGGLWRNHRPEALATPQAFARDPRLVWEWYAWRRELVDGCAPNPAHHALARLAAVHPAARIVTQNVDGLHARAAEALPAGTPPPSTAGDASGPAGRTTADPRRALPLELHGSLFRVRCTRCDWIAEHRGPVDASSPETLPRCPVCGALARPAVVWFGESLDPQVIGEAWALASEADACLVVGTSALVQPAASLPLVVRERGGRIVEVNPERTPLSPVADVVVEGTAVGVVPALLGFGASGPPALA